MKNANYLYLIKSVTLKKCIDKRKKKQWQKKGQISNTIYKMIPPDYLVCAVPQVKL